MSETNIKFGTPTPQEKEDDTLEDVKIGVFFDGTNNNKNNTDAKALYEKQIKGEKISNKELESSISYQENGKDDQSSSYHNDWSNVARMWDNCDSGYSLYIDGIGTFTEKKDELLGGGFGTGDTGMPSRVNEACELLAGKLPKGKEIPTLTIDVYGFSRGAAAARLFVDHISQKGIKEPKTKWQYKWGTLGYYLKKRTITVDRIKIRFLGLFDTVSSYSKYVQVPPDFRNDLTELNLHNLGAVRQVVHFTAMDEHRENFSLTPTNIGIEKTFPGVHSDIGGSYNDGVEVVKKIDKGSTDEMEQLAEKLVEQCWYIKKELEISTFYKHSLKGTRDLKKTYSFIPLHFMAEKGKINEVPFNNAKLENKYKITDDDLLVKVKERLRDYIFDNGKPYIFEWYGTIQKKYEGSKIPQKQHAEYLSEMEDQKNLRTLRNKYLHWSADKAGVGMGPNSDRKRFIL
jgi:Uncharacterized alpha/beta hydrolase domain (DUF2235)